MEPVIKNWIRVKSRFELPRKAGCYAMINDTRKGAIIIYVGQSINLFLRMSNHHIRRNKHSHIEYRLMAKSRLAGAEKRTARKYKPEKCFHLLKKEDLAANRYRQYVHRIYSYKKLERKFLMGKIIRLLSAGAHRAISITDAGRAAAEAL